MEPKKNNIHFSNEFIVRQDDINDEGILATCNLLREITSLYDQAIVLAFGDLSYYRVVTSSYQLDFLKHAYLGDKINIQSDASVHFGLSLEVNITVHKKNKRNEVLATGNFIFNLQNKLQPICLSLPECCL
jgi:acyl-CoA thioesterase FadM